MGERWQSIEKLIMEKEEAYLTDKLRAACRLPNEISSINHFLEFAEDIGVEKCKFVHGCGENINVVGTLRRDRILHCRVNQSYEFQERPYHYYGNRKFSFDYPFPPHSDHPHLVKTRYGSIGWIDHLYNSDEDVILCIEWALHNHLHCKLIPREKDWYAPGKTCGIEYFVNPFVPFDKENELLEKLRKNLNRNMEE